MQTFKNFCHNWISAITLLQGRNVFKIAEKDVKEEKIISEGGYAYVWMCRDIDTNDIYALKKLYCQDRERYKAALREISFLESIGSHPNIVSYYGSCVQNIDRKTKQILILLEYCDGGTLADLIEKSFMCVFNNNTNKNKYMHNQEQCIHEDLILKILSDISQGLFHLHTQKPPVVHRDIKIENILLQRNTNLYKICDFGSCAYVQTSVETKEKKISDNGSAVSTEELERKQQVSSEFEAGMSNRANVRQLEENISATTTLMYRPPEMIYLHENADISEKADIWMLGCVLYVLLFGKHPFQDESTLAIVNANYHIPHNHSHNIKIIELLEWMLSINATHRPSSEELLNVLRLYHTYTNIPLPKCVRKYIDEANKKRQLDFTLQNPNLSSLILTEKDLSPCAALHDRLNENKNKKKKAKKRKEAKEKEVKGKEVKEKEVKGKEVKEKEDVTWCAFEDTAENCSTMKEYHKSYFSSAEYSKDVTHISSLSHSLFELDFSKCNESFSKIVNSDDNSKSNSILDTSKTSKKTRELQKNSFSFDFFSSSCHSMSSQSFFSEEFLSSSRLLNPDFSTSLFSSSTNSHFKENNSSCFSFPSSCSFNFPADNVVNVLGSSSVSNHAISSSSFLPFSTSSFISSSSSFLPFSTSSFISSSSSFLPFSTSSFISSSSSFLPFSTSSFISSSSSFLPSSISSSFLSSSSSFLPSSISSSFLSSACLSYSYSSSSCSSPLPSCLPYTNENNLFFSNTNYTSNKSMSDNSRGKSKCMSDNMNMLLNQTISSSDKNLLSEKKNLDSKISAHCECFSSDTRIINNTKAIVTMKDSNNEAHDSDMLESEEKIITLHKSNSEENMQKNVSNSD